MPQSLMCVSPITIVSPSMTRAVPESSAARAEVMSKTRLRQRMPRPNLKRCLGRELSANRTSPAVKMIGPTRKECCEFDQFVARANEAAYCDEFVELARQFAVVVTFGWRWPIHSARVARHTTLDSAYLLNVRLPGKADAP